MRVGIGYDIHRLVRGRKLVLGGVEISYPKGLLGHSDGDALGHALVDAALGAAALGDIGEYFSDKDPANKGKKSADFVRVTRGLLAKKGWRVSQIDAVILAQKPRLSIFRDKIKRNVARQWGLLAGRVNIKAKTNEGLDAVGRGQAIACHAVVVLSKRR